jgi:acyl carrier protein
MDNIEERVKKILADQFECKADEIDLSQQFTNAHQFCDSLDIIELTMCVEDEFGLEIDDEQMWSIKTGQQIVEIVRAKVPA